VPLNTLPIFPGTPKVSWATLTAANTAKDGTGTVATVFTAGANGGRVDYLKVRAKGTNVATVLRVFINNGSDSTVAENNSLFVEQTIAATTLSEVAMLADTAIQLDVSIPAGYVITCTLGTAVAAGLQVTAVGGNY
jgi:hypothetical protein